MRYKLFECREEDSASCSCFAIAGEAFRRHLLPTAMWHASPTRADCDCLTSPWWSKLLSSRLRVVCGLNHRVVVRRASRIAVRDAAEWSQHHQRGSRHAECFARTCGLHRRIARDRSRSETSPSWLAVGSSVAMRHVGHLLTGKAIGD